MKKLLALVLALTMVMGLFSFASAEARENRENVTEYSGKYKADFDIDDKVVVQAFVVCQKV